MGADKLEKYIKRTLEEREITPSASAWNKIEQQLEAPAQHNKRSWYVYGVAASVLLLLGVAITFMIKTNSNVVTPSIQLVDQENKPTDFNQIEQKNNLTVVPKETLPLQVVAEVPIKEEKKAPKTAVAIAHIEKEIKQEENAVVHQESGVGSPVQQVESILDHKVTEMIAQIKNMEQYSSVTDAEIDSLLARAQQDILKESIFYAPNKVDPMALLSEVEEDLDKSFRAKIFDTLKDKFLKARTAVADRNN